MVDVTMKEEAEESTKAYIGDSVYAEVVNGMIKLTTESGLPSDPSNKIFIELRVLDVLVAYAERYKERLY